MGITGGVFLFVGFLACVKVNTITDEKPFWSIPDFSDYLSVNFLICLDICHFVISIYLFRRLVWSPLFLSLPFKLVCCIFWGIGPLFEDS